MANKYMYIHACCIFWAVYMYMYIASLVDVFPVYRQCVTISQWAGPEWVWLPHSLHPQEGNRPCSCQLPFTAHKYQFFREWISILCPETISQQWVDSQSKSQTYLSVSIYSPLLIIHPIYATQKMYVLYISHSLVPGLSLFREHVQYGLWPCRNGYFTGSKVITDGGGTAWEWGYISRASHVSVYIYTDSSRAKMLV